MKRSITFVFLAGIILVSVTGLTISHGKNTINHELVEEANKK